MRKLLLAISLTVICSVCMNAQNQKSAVTKDFFLTDDNNRMYYEAYGSGKTAIVFVHGWSATCRSWDDQIDFFKGRYKVILIDLIGFGNSEHNRQDWSVQHYGADIAGLCRKLKLKNVYLVGWSLGTGIVVEAARNLGKEAKTVIPVDQLWEINNVFNNAEAEKWFETEVSRFKDYNALTEYWTGDSIITAKLISMRKSEDKMPDWWKPSIISFFKWLADDLKPSVSELKIPIRAINGSWVKTNETQWKTFYKDYKLSVFENSNHFLVWQYPQKFNETLLQIISETSK